MTATLMSFRVKTTDKYSIQRGFGVWLSYNRNSQWNCNTYFHMSNHREEWDGKGGAFYPKVSPSPDVHQ